MKIIYYQNDIPGKCPKSIFLAGPTPRSDEVKSWRPEALAILENLYFDGYVIVPEYDPKNSVKKFISYEAMVEWELKGLDKVNVISFWVPRDLKTMPAFTTNTEYGYWIKSGKCVYGRPFNAPNTSYLDYLYKKHSPYRPWDKLDALMLHAATFSTYLEESKQTVNPPNDHLRELFHKAWGEAHDSLEYKEQTWRDLRAELEKSGINV